MEESSTTETMLEEALVDEKNSEKKEKKKRKKRKGRKPGRKKKPGPKKKKKPKVKKRKVGRPKKRGPKWKRPSRAKKKVKEKVYLSGKNHWNSKNYSLVAFRNGKQIRAIGKYKTLDDLNEVLGDLMIESDKVVFPELVGTSKDGFLNSKYEYLILEKNWDGELMNQKFRNDYGKIVEQKLNTEKWVILDKVKFNVEETFWIYGKNPRTQRMTIQDVISNLIYGDNVELHSFKRVSLYYNKVVIKDDYGKIDMVICKTISDGIRLYNKLEELLNGNGKTIFIGTVVNDKESRERMLAELVEYTGWSKYKLNQKTSRKFKYDFN